MLREDRLIQNIVFSQTELCMIGSDKNVFRSKLLEKLKQAEKTITALWESNKNRKAVGFDKTCF